MNQVIEREIRILHADFEEYSVDEKIAASDRLNAASGIQDLPQLIELIKSSKSDFWVRELLSEPICELGGPKYLEDLFDALELNRQDGHDNDTFHHHLTEIAWADSNGCREKLSELLVRSDFKHREAAEWLMGFCS